MGVGKVNHHLSFFSSRGSRRANKAQNKFPPHYDDEKIQEGLKANTVFKVKTGKVVLFGFSLSSAFPGPTQGGQDPLSVGLREPPRLKVSGLPPPRALGEKQGKDNWKWDGLQALFVRDLVSFSLVKPTNPVVGVG